MLSRADKCGLGCSRRNESACDAQRGDGGQDSDRWNESEELYLKNGGRQRKTRGEDKYRTTSGDAAEGDQGHDEAEENQPGGECEPECRDQRRQTWRSLPREKNNRSVTGRMEPRG